MRKTYQEDRVVVQILPEQRQWINSRGRNAAKVIREALDFYVGTPNVKDETPTIEEMGAMALYALKTVPPIFVAPNRRKRQKNTKLRLKIPIEQRRFIDRYGKNASDIARKALHFHIREVVSDYQKRKPRLVEIEAEAFYPDSKKTNVNSKSNVLYFGNMDRIIVDEDGGRVLYSDED